MQSAKTRHGCRIKVFDRSDITQGLSRWHACANWPTGASLTRHPGWLTVLAQAMKHEPYCVEATVGAETVGLLPLSFVRSLLFGRFLVSLPYLNSGGVMAKDESVATALIDRAVRLSDKLDVHYLELRHEAECPHPALTETLANKVHMRLPLPCCEDALWRQFKPKVRNQVRKAEKLGLSVHWGGHDLLGEFYAVFAHNMRDLGTPVFSRRLFHSVLAQFSNQAEICVVRLRQRPVAAGLLVHGSSVSDVLSASSLRAYNSTNANMLMYWHLLKRAVERGQKAFDFGRSSIGSNTFRFKKQWGARPAPATWQYYVRRGSVTSMRRENGKYDRFVGVWRHLPVSVTRVIGPAIVRGIP